MYNFQFHSKLPIVYSEYNRHDTHTLTGSQSPSPIATPFMLIFRVAEGFAWWILYAIAGTYFPA